VPGRAGIVAFGVAAVVLAGPAAAAPAAQRLAVTVSAPAPLPAGAKPDGGLRVALRADSSAGRAGARRATAEIVPTTRADRLAVVLRATGVARVSSPTRAALATSAGKASRLAFEWAAERDGLGAVEAEARSLGRGGRVLATSRSTLFVLRFGNRVLTSTSGPLDLQARRVQALDGLSTLTRAQRLERVLGAGATTTTSSRAAAGPAIAVGGTVRFTDGAGGTHPARQAGVELREKTLNGSQALGTASTDDQGRYAIAFEQPTGVADVAHAAGYNLFVRALAAGPGYSVEGPNGVYRIDSSVARNARRGTALTLDLVANNVADNNTAFSVGEAMLEVHEYVVKIGMPVPAIVVDYPTKDVTSNYSFGKLHMLRGDRFDTDVAHHEYGHYVSDRLAIQRNPGGMHSGVENLSEARGKDAGTRLAWGEGWPTYFGTTLQAALSLGRAAIPTVGDSRYTDTDDASIDYELEVPTPNESIGEDGETAVQRFLWDVYDSARDPGDDVSLGDRPIMNALIARKAITLSQAYAALVRDVPPRTRAAIGCIAAQQRISPKLTAPANGSPLPAQPPTFAWVSGGGGPKFRNDSFVVQFYDASLSTLLHETPKLDRVSRFTPTDATWQKVTSGRKKINVIVRGSQTSAPVTGPYDSCPLQLGS